MLVGIPIYGGAANKPYIAGIRTRNLAYKVLNLLLTPPGSLLTMEINVVHAPSINMSPRRRLTLYIDVCPVDIRSDLAAPPKCMTQAATPAGPYPIAHLEKQLLIVLGNLE
jgi:hypothetical protein